MNDDLGKIPSSTAGGGVQRDGGDWPALWFFQDNAARLVIARDLTVLAANGAAASLIESNITVSLRDGGLVTRDRRSAAELNAIVAEAGPGARVGLVGSDGPSAVLVDSFALGDGADSPVALLLRDLRASVRIECADLESVFNVTPGEHQVIVELVKGYSSREIAEGFGKSILTVRTHVKRAYGKIGVKTRGQLFAKLLPYLSIR